ncbi:MAG TPA: metallophosphoesterase [Bryobacteraceae bacterium]|nr:metallophosphoesterase [Bryobacteraceae bacterium]
MRLRAAVTIALFAAAIGGLILLGAPEPDSFRFVLLGDRTGEAAPGVYERVWKDAAAAKPAFFLSVGDTIQGLDDATAEAQWREAEKLFGEWKQFPLYLAPGNHDIWSERSEQLFRKYSGHPAHYSFDYGNAHFTILDNSRSDEMPATELAFLEQDLAQHKAQSPKFIVSHRPSWIVKAIIGDPGFRLHQIAKKYGARYVIAGHVHEMLHAELEGVDYVSMASAGGHLRASGKYADGWFFGYAVVDVGANGADFHIHELGAPWGEGRASSLSDWGPAGLRTR